ncbi:MAG: YicC family protein [Sphingobacteriales bacterium]|nr:YicC family protein [Sphingobacteriales bacterium]
MTGYGKADALIGDKQVKVELRSLNSSKQLDMGMRLPFLFRAKEADLRKLIAQKAVRGKVDMLVTIESAANPTLAINKTLFRSYLQELQSIADSLQLPPQDLVAAVLRLPEITAAEPTAHEHELEQLQQLVEQALENLQHYRAQEGNLLMVDFQAQIAAILQKLDTVKNLAPLRLQKVRDQLRESLQRHLPDAAYDPNRFEQELIYYIEKLDISEEISRLQNHCYWFRSELASAETEKGKKLNFIAQEIGREINTIGSKANDSNIQVAVVDMKDELEKIKEQLLNIL